MGQLSLSDTYHKLHSDIASRKQSVTIRQVSRWLTVAVAGTVLALTLVINSPQGSQAAVVTSTSYGHAVPASLIGTGTFTPPDPSSKTITYNTALVPVGAAILASMEPSGRDYSQTVALVTVAGLLPNTSYAVHAHINPCGVTNENISNWTREHS
jgi:hypothetical protein